MLKSKIKHMQGRYIDSRKGTIINGMRHEELFRLCSCAGFVVTLCLLDLCFCFYPTLHAV